MKKLVFITPVVLALNGFSQEQMQNFNSINLIQQQVTQQFSQVFASNIKVNDSNANKPLRANANPAANINIQRVSTSNSSQRSQRRRRVNLSNNNTNINVSNISQGNLGNAFENNINDNVLQVANNDIQVQGNFINQMDNNIGNKGNPIEQLASLEIPAIQVGTGSLNLSLDINMPKINLKSIKFSSRKTTTSSSRKSFHFKNKLAKLNRKISGKLSFGKKLKIKVDNCFKW